jgi:hypothetical protein
VNADVEAVITELDSHRARFEAFCRALTSEQLTRPVPKSTWVVKDFISHLATIDVPVGEMFRSMHGEGTPGFRGQGGASWNVDTWNDRQVAERRSRTVDEILAEAEKTRAALTGYLRELTAEDMAKTLKFGGDSKRPPAEVRLLDYLRGWNKHDPMHVVDMLRALPELTSPELDAWFDHPAIRGYQAAMNAGS